MSLCHRLTGAFACSAILPALVLFPFVPVEKGSHCGAQTSFELPTPICTVSQGMTSANQ